MNAKAVIAAAPDLLLMASEHAEAPGGVEAVLNRHEFALTPGRFGRSLTLPALTILRLGSRTPQSSANCATRCRPDTCRAQAPDAAACLRERMDEPLDEGRAKSRTPSLWPQVGGGWSPSMPFSLEHPFLANTIT
jgi:hypothetical protein